jgi:hypothetical protein
MLASSKHSQLSAATHPISRVAWKCARTIVHRRIAGRLGVDAVSKPIIAVYAVLTLLLAVSEALSALLAKLLRTRAIDCADSASRLERMDLGGKRRPVNAALGHRAYLPSNTAALPEDIAYREKNAHSRQNEHDGKSHKNCLHSVATPIQQV